MTAETILALMLLLGPRPGTSPYSVVPVAEGTPPACATSGDWKCRTPWWSPWHKSYVRPETYTEGVQRYWDIAQAIATHTAGDDRLARTVITITHHESNWRRDTHSGVGPLAIGDQGRSWCLGQIMLGRNPERRLSIGGVTRDLVGTSPEATGRCIHLTAVMARRATDRCRGSAGATAYCVFAAYGGLPASTTHPGIRARAATYDTLVRARGLALPPDVLPLIDKP